EEAESLLKNDLSWAEGTVNKKVKVKINQNMFNALTSFVYNLGSSIFIESNCTLLRKLNKEDYTGASNEFKRWNKSGGKVLNGLVARRKSEGNLFINL
ncbi:lysozyme, partial [Psychrilyobacter sp.]|uniref:lysozyme n=1 Tax=Psychrilyobacter sp. TaxID=2586924 RepID=UPI0030187C31